MGIEERYWASQWLIGELSDGPGLERRVSDLELFTGLVRTGKMEIRTLDTKTGVETIEVVDAI